MDTVKVLVIDNDIIGRRLFYNALQRIKEVEVRVLCDSEDPHAILNNEEFDIVLLGAESGRKPVNLDLETVKQTYPALWVISTDERTKKGAISIINAIEQGAVDFITKPAKHNSLLLANNHFEKRLKPIIENVRRMKFSGSAGRSSIRPNIKLSRQRARMVVIGSSSEGIRTLATIFKKLPGNLAAPILVVQHFPKIFTRVLAERFNEMSELRVTEAYDGAQLESGTAWIVPGGMHAEVVREDAGYSVRLHRGPRENEMRPSIDVTFRSVARLFREHALGVILDGYGLDGFAGVQSIKEFGGQILLQVPDHLFTKQLAEKIFEAGLADQVCTKEYLSWEIMKRTRLSHPKEKDFSATGSHTAFLEDNTTILSPK